MPPQRHSACTQKFISKVKMGLLLLEKGRWGYGGHCLLKKGDVGHKNIEGDGQGWDPSVKESKVLDFLKLVST